MSNKLQSFKNTAIAFSIVSIIVCFIFNYRLFEEFVIDLRIIPIMVGGLYAGIGPIVGLLTIILRGLYGFNIGYFATSIFIIVISLIFWRIFPWFLKLSARQRIIFFTGMTFIVSFFPPLFMDIYQKDNLGFDIYFAYLLLQPIGALIISITIEITCKTVKLHQHLVKAERLEVVEKMAAAISHEIRNPLTSAIGFVQLMQDETISKDKSDQYLSILKSELFSAEKVIRNFLTLSKPELPTVETLNVNSELQFVINKLQPAATRSLVSIQTKWTESVWIHGDRQSFHQCFINIIKNSIEAMENGGTVTVEVESTSTNIDIRVQDTGKGMTQEQIEHLGEPYYSTKGEMGTGLGVMVAFNIVRAMKGKINIKSEIGKGTSFEFSFPIEEQQREKASSYNN
ncbi:ATP-binding protein [Lederbergia wuyishanensis]